MKLNDIAVFLQERLFAITGNGGKNDHVHRVDFSQREGKTSIDEKHYHNYRLGDKVTTGTVQMPAGSGVKNHDHTLPMLLKEGHDFERVFAFLSTLEKSDFQQLANPLNEPKPDAPLNLRIESHPHEGIKLKMTFYNTGNKYAIETLGRYIAPMLKEVGINPNRTHYHVIPYSAPVPPMDPEMEVRPPEVDFEHVEDKANLTMAVAIIGHHAIKEGVEEDQLDEAVNARKVALNLLDALSLLKNNTKATKTAALDTFEIMGDREKKIVNTWVTDLIGAARRATGKSPELNQRKEGIQEALSPALVAFDLSDVVDEAARNKPALKQAVKTSMRSLSLKEQNVISNWVAVLVDLVTPKG